MKFVKGIICAIFLTASTVLQGQVPGAGKAASHIGKELAGQAVHGGSSRIDVLARLQERMRRSYEQALRVQQKYSGSLFEDWPSKCLVKGYTFNCTNPSNHPILQSIYPARLALSAEQVPAHFIYQHNLRLRHWLPILNARQEALSSYKNELEKYRVEVSHPRDADMRWLADRVTDETKYLLLGERHGFPEITNSIATFILSLRLKYPDREIFLLTEFLPENKHWAPSGPEDLFDNKQPVWSAAKTMDIPIIGLEPQYVMDLPDVTLQCTDCFGGSREQAAWATIEGIRLRNERWLRVIHNFRKQHPDALFVIYGGGGHMRYSEPYSLGSYLASDHTQVVAIYPMTSIGGWGEISTIVDEFDSLTEGIFPQRVLWWNNPAAAKIAGFDIRIKVPVSHEKH